LHRLFLKIFGWFWLAQIFIGLVMYQIMTVVRSSSDSSRNRTFLSSHLNLQARTAALIYEHEGVSALMRETRRWRRGNSPLLFIFNNDGRTLIAERAAPPVRELARRAARNSKPQPVTQGDMQLVARAAPLHNGQTLVLVAELPRRTPNLTVIDLRNPARLGWVRVGVLLVTSGLVCYALALYLASPAMKLRHATRQLASGDLSARVAAQMGRRRDELADLGRDFDQMAERIESLMMSERRLLGDISHELRSPLARLMVALDLAESDLAETDTDATTLSYLARIRRESERLNELIGQLLALSKLESGSAKVEETPVDLSELLHDVAQDAAFEAQGRNRNVQIVSSEACYTRGDATLLRSAVENVVRNGIHYTAENTSVELHLKCCVSEGHKSGKSVKHAILTVRDHGPGVPPETLEHLFRPFYRVADARDRLSGGTGLGLAITERAVRFHGGSVRAANAEGGGLLIEIQLPVTSAQT
jgi:signal transduction histidine kinase